MFSLDLNRENIMTLMSKYISRLIEKNLKQTLQRGKSILLLGPRQTGKTTLIREQICPDIHYSFASVSNSPTLRKKYRFIRD